MPHKNSKSMPQKKSQSVIKLVIKNYLYLFLMPVLIPASWMLHTINRYGVNVPYSDEWLIVPIFQRIDEGIISFKDFWRPMSYHRLFFTNILITSAAYLTNWNIRFEMYLSFVFCIITTLIIYLIARSTINNRFLVALVMLISGFWLFSPVQMENWLWGWDVAWFMCVASAVASIYFISRLKKSYFSWYLVLAISLAMFSTFSFGWGQAIWPVGLLLLLVQKNLKKPALIWAGSALLGYAAYYFRFNHTGAPVPLLAFLQEPINAISYFIVIFGRPFTYNLYPAMFLGAISIMLLIPVLILVWERRKKFTIYLPWLGLILFSLAGALMIVLGRLNADPKVITPLQDAMQPRYTGMSILYIVGLSGLIITLVDSMKLSRKIIKYFVLLNMVIMIPLVWSSYHVGLVTANERYKLMRKLQDCSRLSVEKVEKDCLSSNNYLNNFEVAKKQLNYLKGKNWAGY